MNTMANAEVDPPKTGRHGPALRGPRGRSEHDVRGNVRNEHLNDAACWNAVVGHDRDADGLFVYGVRSTGVFCRPSCPSRRPRRDRVAFFETTAAAREAGFRACLRCKPDDSGAVEDPWVEKI